MPKTQKMGTRFILHAKDFGALVSDMVEKVRATPVLRAKDKDIFYQEFSEKLKKVHQRMESSLAFVKETMDKVKIFENPPAQFSI